MQPDVFLLYDYRLNRSSVSLSGFWGWLINSSIDWLSWLGVSMKLANLLILHSIYFQHNSLAIKNHNSIVLTKHESIEMTQHNSLVMVPNGHSKRKVGLVTRSDACARGYAGYPSQGAF